MMVPTQEQVECVELAVKHKLLKINAKAGSGKAQPLDCIVKTPNGDVEIGKLSVGDKVFKSDGSVGAVTGIFPQDGLQKTYRVTFRDGSSTRCNPDHLWSVYSQRRNGRFITKSLQTIVEEGIFNSSGGMKCRIPLCSPLQYTEQNYKIKPYLLGIFIGDGYLCGSTPAFSVGSKDAEIFNLVKDIHPEFTYSGKITGENCVQYNVTNTLANLTNGVMTEIKSLGLNVKSKEKRIPYNYLIGSVEQRKELLRGLMDSDGSVVKNRTSYTTTSKGLVADLKTLVQSLGGTAIEIGTDTRNENPCYVVNIKTVENPFKVSSKASLWKKSTKNPPSRYIKSVEYWGECEQVCISVDAEDSLYLTDECIVTHNTSTLMMISDAIKKPSLYLAYNKSMANEAKNKFPNHVTVNTVHGLAYRFIGKDYAHKLSRPVGRYVNVACTGSEIGKYYKLPDLKAGNNELGEARIVNKNYLGLIIRDTTNKFEQSDDKFLEYKHIPQHHIKDITKRYPDLDIKKLNKMLVNYANRLWDDRTDVMSDVLCTHDTYLKLFELSSPVLEDYDVVYLDESQDSNSVTLSIFMNQSNHAKLILVGDNRQQIYGWRGAENAMKKIHCPEALLSKSFRFGEKIAGVASAIIKEPVTGNEAVNSIIGEFDAIDYEQPYTILFRKNSTLVYKALDLIQDGIKVSINIDLKDFVSMLTSALELSTGNIKKVKHESIIPYSNWGELVEEAKSVPELGRMVAIIKSDRAAEVIQTLHNYKVDARDVQITLTTAHKSKGLEFNYVLLADDFPSPYNDKGEYVGLTTEEENLLYVSATRAKRVLQYNPTVTTLLTLSGYTTERNVKTS